MKFITTLFAVLAILSSVSASPTMKKRATVETIDNCSQQGTVALTFDDGPYDYEAQVASALDGGKGTFFLNGANYVCIYDKADSIRALYDAGHTLGSHTWSHADLTQLDESGINDELSKVEDAFVKILGVKPRYFRPPYGNINDNVLKVLGERGYTKVFLWSDDTGDANGESVSYSEGVLDGVIQDYPNPHLVLDHSTIETTSSQVLPYAVPKLKSAGYQLVTVGECLGTDESPYEWVDCPGERDSSWQC
ncbi:deacetylase [Cryptococcus neoformans]|uniref:Deacetylase n=2 Tax=Cryptococcus neoformans TaxID=5207 RepID=A0A854Q4N1_CRYNE|nr:deacetylase [Cryptococcus neoformans var. grubii H99]AUB28683.1 deacetylase [Cryptococcus neoformans var. grubii]OWT35731.1 deacetylase [Cryptococcus neoformans var. grubii Bt1]OWZ26856.1 deacetylase [Cryptococcus neoformans var. grubii AD2-60a]OWZ28300.1 deacetylase [Cryptococcus neoformans var. grubii AD1-83a]OWZ38717.1 deacetylase [Cryptococcus neoformans var. grubii C23]OWZ50189.1 deacetylase [Cryptococcus neoformans var. grubii 125.91]OWZ75071.1 deacetylase [Cryptococcus neoformans v|eukprot:XP_012053383.1 deacetylase [Cryptococcus neoformans var. grubii H99]